MLIDNMKRRLIIAFAVLLPLVIFGATKWTAKERESWRPVAIGKVEGADTISIASQQYLSIYSNSTGADTRFDLKTGTQRAMNSEDILPVGDWKWKLVLGNKVQIQLSRANRPTKIYECPDFEADGMKPNFPDWIRVSPQDNRFEALLVNRYYCWELSSHRLKLNTVLGFSGGAVAPFGRDGRTLAIGDDNGVKYVSTRSGRVVRRVPLVAANYQVTQLSALGTYALCQANNSIPTTVPFLVADSQTGRILWKFDIENWWGIVLLSHNEKLLALPHVERDAWEIHETKTGRLIRTLPLMTGVTSGAFSPDNSTLYSVADGVIYRQRAR